MKIYVNVTYFENESIFFYFLLLCKCKLCFKCAKFLTIYWFQGLEATLSDSKKKYGDKVNALLSAWEHVTNFIPAASPDTIKALIEWAHKSVFLFLIKLSFTLRKN